MSAHPMSGQLAALGSLGSQNYPNASAPWQTYCTAATGYNAQCLASYTWNHAVGSPSHSQWNGCVTDRDQNYDTNATVPELDTTLRADQDQSCPAAQLLPLTYNWTTVNTTINAMSPGGATNQTIGLLWGWLSLLQQIAAECAGREHRPSHTSTSSSCSPTA